MDPGTLATFVGLGIQLTELAVKHLGGSKDTKEFAKALVESVTELKMPTSDQAMFLNILVSNLTVRELIFEKPHETNEVRFVKEFKFELDRRGAYWDSIVEARIKTFFLRVIELHGMFFDSVSAVMRYSQLQLQETIAVKEEVAGLKGMVREYQKQFTPGLDDLTSQLAVHYSVLSTDLRLPQTVSKLSDRKETVTALLALLAKHTFTYLYGDVGTGKSHLAILAARTFVSPVAWISFSGIKEQSQLHPKLDISLCQFAQVNLELNTAKLYEEIIMHVPQGSFIVLDDLPRLTRDFIQRLVLMTRLAKTRQLSILLTSPFKPTSTLRDVLDPELFCETKVPDVTNQEALEIFKAHGMPETVTNRVEPLNNLSRQNPTLVTAVARYMATRNWAIDEKTFDDLLGQKLGADFQRETLSRLLSTVEKEDSRNLLYRLKEIMGSFSLRQVEVVSSVKPEISNPFEKLMDLEGLWVQAKANDTYSLSPLVNQVAEHNLSEETQKRVNFGLAEDTLKGKRIDQRQLSNGILYWVKAEEFERAGHLLIVGLDYLEENPKLLSNKESSFTYSDMWMSTSLPPSMRLDQKLKIRLSQLSIRELQGKDQSYLLDDIDLLLEQASPTDFIGNATKILLANSFNQLSFDKAIQYTTDFFRNRENMSFPGGIALDALQNLSDVEGNSWTPGEFEQTLSFFSDQVGQLLWVLTARITKPEQVFSWLRIFDQAPGALRDVLETNNLDGWKVLADRLYLHEYNKAPKDRDWEQCLSSLQKLEEKALELEIEPLWVWTIANKLTVIAENIGKVEAAAELYASSLEKGARDPHTVFALKHQMGVQYKFANDYEKALPLLTEASELSTDHYKLERAYAFLYLSNIFTEREEHSDGIFYAKKACDLVEASPDISRTFLVRCLGELSIAHLEAKNKAGVVEALDKAARLLLDNQKNSRTWETLLVFVALTARQLMVLEVDEPSIPESAKPRPGMMLLGDREFEESEIQNRLKFLPSLMVLIARDIKDEIALDWALRMSNQPLDVQSLNPAMYQYLLVHFLRTENYPRVLETAVVLATCFVGMRRVRENSAQYLKSGVVPSVFEVTAGLTEEEQATVYTQALGFALLPLQFQLSLKFFENEEETLEHMSSITAAFGELTREFPNSESWQEALGVIVASLTKRINSEDFILKGNAHNQDDLRVIYYFAASREGKLRNSLQGHKVINGYLSTWKQVLPFMYKELFTTYIEKHWRTKFGKQRFLFNAPRLVESALDEALLSPLLERADKILNAVDY